MIQLFRILNDGGQIVGLRLAYVGWKIKLNYQYHMNKRRGFLPLNPTYDGVMIWLTFL